MNPLKCVLYVTAGCLLGFIVSQSGITIDPLKVQAIAELPPPTKYFVPLQSLQSKSNFLCRFVPDYATTAHGFLCLLRTYIPFFWDDQAHQSFDALKNTLMSAPFIFPLDYNKDLILYVSASPFAVAGMLVQEAENGCEHIIYCISHNLAGPSLSYNYDEKLTLVVIFSVQKLSQYILTRKTKVVTNSTPMLYLLSRWIINGKFTHWIVILQEFDLEFATPKSNKALVLAEFLSNLPSLRPSLE